MISCVKPPVPFPGPLSFTIAIVACFKAPSESVETSLPTVPVDNLLPNVPALPIVSIVLIRLSPVIAADILLTPAIILFRPSIALLATLIPKSDAARPISEPISRIYLSVLPSHVLNPL